VTTGADALALETKAVSTIEKIKLTVIILVITSPFFVATKGLANPRVLKEQDPTGIGH
jgi:hypothetical protein